MIVGMDFGTTNSGMSVYDGEKLRLLPLDPSNDNAVVARTALYITNQKRITIGREAVERYYSENLNREVRFERVWVGEVEMIFAELPPMLHDVFIEKDVLSPGRLFLSFKTGLSASSYVGTTVGADFYFIEDITALYLYIARRRAERLLGTPLKRIVLGRPVRFNIDPQADKLAQQRLLAAAFRAGYEEVYFQYEPIAAAYFYETTIDQEQNVLVFDFGGGTLDVSIVRLGNPRRRAILATDGIPVAGDVFDRKIARSKLPPHFGEYSSYRGEFGAPRPVPNHYFEAFSDWQMLLELNTPRNLRTLERIARTAHKRRQIEALIHLIKSSYGLRIYDEVETAKRELSTLRNALIQLDGPGFNVREMITRAEFDRLIADERAAIDTLLDDVVAQAGLTTNQIDAVIRTGGSSQVPVFVDMLNERFGADKVRAINTFSSVTSGLGIIAHGIAQGDIDAKPYRAGEWSGGGRLLESTDPQRKRGVPPVNLDVVKRIVEVQENAPSGDGHVLSLVSLDATGDVRAALHTLEDTDTVPVSGIELAGSLPAGVFAVPPEMPILMMTTEYRLLLRNARELAEMHALGLRLADVENLRVDKFGAETVSGLHPWLPGENVDYLALISTSGHAKLLRADTILERIEQPVPYSLGKISGYPAALVPLRADDDMLVFSSAGNVLRTSVENIRRAGSRIMRANGGTRVVGAERIGRAEELVLANGKGRGKRLAIDTLSPATQLAAGQRVITSQFRAVAIGSAQPGDSLWAITSQRLQPLDWPDANSSSGLRSLLRIRKGEELVGLQIIAAQA